jgi:hypothetical protein
MNQNSSSTENWITVKEINNNVIVLDNKKLVSGIKVLPKNIFIMDELSQNRVIDELRKFYNQIDFEFWLIVADRPTNIDLYVSQLELQLNNVSRPAIRKLIIDDIAKADGFVQNDVVDTEYFVLFKADTQEEITKNVRGLISNLAQSGLIGAQVSNEDLRMLLDNFLNDGKTFTERTVTTE